LSALLFQHSANFSGLSDVNVLIPHGTHEIKNLPLDGEVSAITTLPPQNGQGFNFSMSALLQRFDLPTQSYDFALVKLVQVQ
jgi:hypothetical protein